LLTLFCTSQLCNTVRYKVSYIEFNLSTEESLLHAQGTILTSMPEIELQMAGLNLNHFRFNHKTAITVCIIKLSTSFFIFFIKYFYI
jgi:hypothetical protein